MTDDTDRSNARERAEENAVRRLGDAVGYGRIMQLAGKLWGETLVRLGHPPGGEFAIGPCVAFMVACPCPEDGRDDDGHCEWCCGAGQVTERVRATMGQPRAVPGWRKTPPTVDEVREHPWWWNRSPGGTRHVLHLDVNIGSDVIIDVEEAAAHDCGGGRFDPDAWPGEWAPCLPPAEGGQTS